MYSMTAHSMAIRVSCLFLCFLMLFMGFADVLTTPARANAAVVAIPAVLGVLALMGMSFASAGAAVEAAKGFYNSSVAIKQNVDSLFSHLTDSDSLPIDAYTLPFLVYLMSAVKSYFPANRGVVEITEPDYGTFGGVVFTEITSFSSSREAYEHAYYSVRDEVTLTVNGVDYIYRFTNPTSFSGCKMIVEKNGVVTPLYGESQNTGVASALTFVCTDGSASRFYDYRFGFQLKKIGSTTYLHPFTAASWEKSTGEIAYYRHENMLFRGENASLVPAISGTATNIEPFIRSVPYEKFAAVDSDALFTVMQSLSSKTETVELPITDMIELTEAGEADTEKKIPYVPDLTWLQEKLNELGLSVAEINAIAQDISYADTDNPSIDTMDPEKITLPQNIIYKFPFCVPFDLIALVGALNTQAAAPVFTIPLKFDFLNYYDELTIDLTGWGNAALAIRWGTTLFFILGLTMVTRKMIKG